MNEVSISDVACLTNVFHIVCVCGWDYMSEVSISDVI